MNKISYLSKITLFESLPMDDLMEIDRMAPMTTLPKKTVIQTPDQYREGMYVVKQGKLRLYKVHSDGKQFTHSILGPGNLFGELDTISLGTREMFIETIEETVLCSLGKEQFEQFITARPQLAMKLLSVLSERLMERDALLEKLALGDILERVAHLLLQLSKQFGTEQDGFHKIDISLSHQEIAYMIGATRESVTGILNELAREGVIRTGRMSIEVDRTGLQHFLDQRS